MRRLWKLAIIMSVGVTPGAFAGCFQTYGEKTLFLDAALANPWDPTTGFVAKAASQFLNPVPDPEVQKFLNTVFASIQTAIRSEVTVNTPQSWADVGRPR